LRCRLRTHAFPTPTRSVSRLDARGLTGRLPPRPHLGLLQTPFPSPLFRLICVFPTCTSCSVSFSPTLKDAFNRQKNWTVVVVFFFFFFFTLCTFLGVHYSVILCSVVEFVLVLPCRIHRRFSWHMCTFLILPSFPFASLGLPLTCTHYFFALHTHCTYMDSSTCHLNPWTLGTVLPTVFFIPPLPCLHCLLTIPH